MTETVAPRDGVPGPKADAPVIDAQAALREERAALGLGADAVPAALCLSGGGIRSAAFCLGVIQAFARHGLLAQIHYLSTVSGGGYAGAFLTRLIAQRSLNSGDRFDPAAVEAEIAAPMPRPEAGVIGNLRRYSNFLTPNPGPVSLDTWAGVLLWLRNTLVNWLVFLPVFGAATGLPVLYFAFVCAVIERVQDADRGFGDHVGYAGAAFLFIAVLTGILRLPSHAHPDTPRAPHDAFGLPGSALFMRVVVPVVLWCLLAAASAAPAVHAPERAEQGRGVFTPVASPVRACPPAAVPACVPDPKSEPRAELSAMMRLPLVSFLACLAAYMGAFLAICWRYRRDGDLLDQHTAPFVTGFVPWLVSAALSALLLLLGIWLAQDLSIRWIALAGPLWVCLAEILRTTLYVALRRDVLRGDSDREWLARLNGVKLLIVLAGSVAGAAIVLGGTEIAPQTRAAWSALLGAGLASGSAAAILGRSAQTAFARRADLVARIPTPLLVNAAIVLFALALLIVVGRGLALLVGAIAAAVGEPGKPPSFTNLALVMLSLVVLAAVTALILGRVINLNRFSMHAVYRNRLIRAFLGSARSWDERRPDRFTQFDPTDNIRMADTFTGRAVPFLFPVVNVALNRTSGRDTARAERKAESFTITPFRCGGPTLPGPGGEGGRIGAYAPTRGYACGDRDTGAHDKEQGISLGGAITISGAAASPNMGYHSSPLTAFVMTLFNVRLGAWLPNPAMRRSREADRVALLRRSGPRNEVPTLLNELLGRSDSDGDFLYLSDGGHFDNLGLYEMLRRRCRLIVVVDAGQDKDYAYEDLARVTQNAQIDLGVEIRFLRQIRIRDRALSPQGALATILYPAAEGEPAATGRLLYIKSYLPEEAPVELLACKVRREDFPHESTANQFFTESEFESYRHLGNYLARTIIGAALTQPEGGPPPPEPVALAKLFDALDARTQVARTSDPPTAGTLGETA